MTRPNMMAVGVVVLAACGEGVVTVGGDFEELDPEVLETASVAQEVRCAPRMTVFPVAAAHNIGYDARSCGSGTCRTSCPDQNANSDWNPAATHNGIDVFAYQRAPMVAVANGTIVRVGTPSRTSGLRVRLRDECGWEYYYGHMDQAVVREGQTVTAGQLIGYMGRTGTGSTHLHFNVSPDGQYLRDINPFELLRTTSPTACRAAPTPTPTPTPTPPTPAPAACGRLDSGQSLLAGQARASCDGRFLLAMQTDGNLVLYQGTRPLWATMTNGRGGAVAAMQGDGNFVVYTAGGWPLFNTGTHRSPGAWLAIQNDGNLVVYQGTTPRWASNTGGR
ncbi:MAG: peptidoglycan DD-metalloendopeptidase family protein [Myxococcaceae bacterium]|nr:peptidoglycan DD-metalloendopeptidase family protein [Myxococcaceae bacterium]